MTPDTKNIVKILSNKCVLNLEYNNIGNYKKDIYLTNSPIAINYLLQCQLKEDPEFKLILPKETENTIVGFDCKEKRFVKLHTSLINSINLPCLEEFNPAALLHCDLTPEQQEKILSAQSSVLDGAVCKYESSKVPLDCPNLDYVINVENALKVLGISKEHINSKNPRHVGKCKKIWYDKIIEAKTNIVNYLKKEKGSCDNKEDIDFIINKIEAFDYKTPISNLHTPLLIAQYWPEILNPRPDFVLGYDTFKSENEVRKMALDRVVDAMDDSLTFKRYRIYGEVEGKFTQYERAVAIKKNADGLFYFCFPIDKTTLVSGEYGISNIYLVNYIYFSKYENETYFYNSNILGNKEFDWWLNIESDTEFTLKSKDDRFELKYIALDEIPNPKECVKGTIVFQES